MTAITPELHEQTQADEKLDKRAYYFIRANGSTAHADRSKPQCFVKGEPAPPSKGYFNHIPYCVREGIARIGWPDTGDLRAAPKTGALANCYSLATLKKHVQRYLLHFRDIAVGSVVLVPDKDRPGELIMGDVTGGYTYFHCLPEHVYENAHRVAVQWDRREGEVLGYTANEIGLSILGGFWTRAFHRIDRTQHRKLIASIDAARMRRRAGGASD